jgi:hypothetical protein
MTTKRALLVSIIIFAGVSLVGAQSPGPPPGSSPEASASPAKKVRKKKAEASPAPATSPEASTSPAKTRGRKKAETSPAPAGSPEASASPAKTRGRKKAETSPAPSASPAVSASPAGGHARKKASASPTAAPAASASPAKPFSIGSLFKPKPTASPAATTTTGSVEANATPAPGGGHGLVWVNSDSHIYHKEGSRFYGKTKQGKYMTEADAIKEGDRAAKTGD